MDDSTAPLFRQIASLIEDSIVDGTLAPGDQAPSTNELAAFHAINPATARKGFTLLVDIGVLEKKRGIGMFVTDQAKALITSRRKDSMAENYIVPLIDEAVKLDFTREEIHHLIEAVAESRGLYK